MTTLIQGYFAGDDLDIERDVTGVQPSDALIKAWLTIKPSHATLDASATVQKIITTAAVPGTGQITEDGSDLQGNGTASIIFQLTAANTNALGTSRYFYDVQVKTASGKIYTTDKGSIQMVQGYTDATT